MTWLKLIGLFFQAVMLVMQWMKDRKGVPADQALKELTGALNERIRVSAAARAARHDDGVSDPYDRAGPPRY